MAVLLKRPKPLGRFNFTFAKFQKLGFLFHESQQIETPIRGKVWGTYSYAFDAESQAESFPHSVAPWFVTK